VWFRSFLYRARFLRTIPRGYYFYLPNLFIKLKVNLDLKNFFSRKADQISNPGPSDVGWDVGSESTYFLPFDRQF
jgi:hypothetical protein